MKTVAILGGSFDPITLGHIDVANYVLHSKYKIDEIWILPNYKSMSGKNLLNGLQRIEMINIACSENPNINVCNFEIKHKLTGTSGENIQKLINNYPMNKFYYIIGMDVANNVENWNNYKEQLNIVPFIVVPRDGVEKKCDWFNESPHIYIENNNIKIRKTSSSEFKKVYHNNNFLNTNVYKYIINNKLYKS